MIDLNQSWPLPDRPLPDRPLPDRPLPIVIFGAGSIVMDAHIPAYLASEFVIRGIFDLDQGKARAPAAQYGFTAYRTAQEAAAQ